MTTAKRFLILPLVCTCVLAAQTDGLAQGEVLLEDNVFTLGMQLGVGARALGMGGAYSYRGGDYSASFWNPAALTDIKRVEFYGALGHLVRGNTSDFAGFTTEDEGSFTDFSTFGVAYPVPTYRGSLVFSFGFNRVKAFDANSEFTWFNATANDSVVQAWREVDQGSLNAWILAGAVDVTPNFSAGLSLNFWTGDEDFGLTFRERDELDIYTFDVFNSEANINSDISGFNLKLGGYYRVGRTLQFGATIATPTTFKVKETSSLFEEILFDADSALVFEDEGFFEYKIRSPFTFTAGGSLHLLNFVFSGEAEYNDWTQVRYTTEPPLIDLDGNPVPKNEANRLIEDNYRATVRVRAGAEFTLPLTGISFRAGYFRDPSILEGAAEDEDRQFYTAGVGFLLDRQVKLDVAYVHGFWKNRNVVRTMTEDVTGLVEDITVNKIVASLAFRF